MPVPALPLPRLLAAALLAITSLGAAPAPLAASAPPAAPSAAPAADDPGFGAPFLVRDLTPSAAPVGSVPDSFVLLPGELYFAAYTPAEGRELYRADGGGVSQVRDVYPGDISGVIGSLTSYNSEVYFNGSTAETGLELWKSDGTYTGTVLVRDVFTGTRDSSPANLIVYNGLLYFVADDGVHGREWWHTDGTPGNTSLLTEIRPGSPSPNIFNPAVFDSRLFFRATNLHGDELWVSDGSPSGTVEFKDLYPGTVGVNQNNSAPTDFTESGGLLFFVATKGQGRELWTTDGTVTNTAQVLDIYPGTLGSSPTELTPKGGGPLVFFSAQEPAAGRELWRSDGTLTGTVRVADIYTGTGYSNPTGLTLYSGDLYFAADDGVHGIELWGSDGVSATALITDINPSGSANVTNLFTNGGNLYFNATDGVHGTELYRYNGTTTTRLTDLNPGGNNTNPNNFVSIAPGNFSLVADDGVHGAELWRFTAPLTLTLAANIAPDVLSSGVEELAGAGADRVYFRLGDDSEPYTSDATFGGTLRIADIVPGPNPDSSYPTYYTGLGDGRAVYQAYTPALGNEPWVSDGTPGGTLPLRDIYTGTDSSNPVDFTLLDGQVLFQAEEPVHGAELWRTDGTPGGTQLVLDINPGSADSYQGEQARLGDQLIFTADDGVHGSELWASDGTPGGTRLVADLNPSGDGYPELMTATRSRVFFIGADENNTTRLWATDGFTATPVFDPDVIDINVPEQMAGAGTGAFLSAYVNNGLYQLYWTDGVTITQISNRPAGADFVAVEDSAAVGDQLFYPDCDLSEGCELWMATPTGVTRVRDIYPGLASSSPAGFVRVGRYVVFAATSPSGGRELWYTDGTEAGTQPLGEIAPGPADANPDNLIVSGHYLFARAYTVANGTELWAVRVPPDKVYVPVVMR